MGASIQDRPLFDTYVEEPQWNKFLTAALACQWGEAQPLPGSGANYGLAVASVTAILRSQGGEKHVKALTLEAEGLGTVQPPDPPQGEAGGVGAPGGAGGNRAAGGGAADALQDARRARGAAGAQRDARRARGAAAQQDVRRARGAAGA